MRVEKELLRVLDLLDGLPVVVFKGGLLTRQLYDDLGARSSVDNDLWLRPPFVFEALARLLVEGYRPQPGLDARRALERDGQVALWTEFTPDAVGADLHAHPFALGMFDVDPDVIERHLVDTDLHGRTVRTFDAGLSFCHLVAHFAQHRLEPGHLREVGAAWDRWSGEEEPLRNLARMTCSEELLEFAVAASHAQGRASRAPLAFRTIRARLAFSLTKGGRRLGGESTARFISLLLVNPWRAPALIYRGVVLEDDQFRARSGQGRSLSQIARRVRHLLQRG